MDPALLFGAIVIALAFVFFALVALGRLPIGCMIAGFIGGLCFVAFALSVILGISFYTLLLLAGLAAIVAVIT